MGLQMGGDRSVEPPIPALEIRRTKRRKRSISRRSKFQRKSQEVVLQQKKGEINAVWERKSKMMIWLLPGTDIKILEPEMDYNVASNFQGFKTSLLIIDQLSSQINVRIPTRNQTDKKL